MDYSQEEQNLMRTKPELELETRICRRKPTVEKTSSSPRNNPPGFSWREATPEEYKNGDIIIVGARKTE
jgi:hypothetical protein